MIKLVPCQNQPRLSLSWTFRTTLSEPSRFYLPAYALSRIALTNARTASALIRSAVFIHGALPVAVVVEASVTRRPAEPPCLEGWHLEFDRRVV